MVTQGRDAGPPADGAEFLSGLVDRVTYHDTESGFCVLRVDVRGRRDQVTVVGHAAQVTPGEHLQATGAWQPIEALTVALRLPA